MYHLSNLLSAMQSPEFRLETRWPSKNAQTFLSNRCRRGLAIKYGINEINVLKASDPFDQHKNPEGYIDFSSADNILSLDLVQTKFDAIDWSLFDRTELNFYTTPGGTPETKAVFARLINEFTTPGLRYPVLPEELLTVAGTTMVCDLLGQVLFDEGDVMLVPSPFYHRFPNDFSDRGLVDLYEVNSFVDDRIGLPLEGFARALKRATFEGKQVRAVLIVNPRNPDAGYYSLDELRPVVEWAVKENGLYVILDEIYDLGVYDPDPEAPFESAIRLFDQDPSLDRNKLIWMSGLSKNFSLPGLRTAVMYTPNREVLAATRRFLMYQGPNAITEFVTRELLGDTQWLHEVFLPESRRRLRQARDRVLAWLKRLRTASGKPVRWIHPRAGFFIFINLSCFMQANTFEEEERLQQRFFDQKVLFVRGNSLTSSQPGWFRIVFSAYNLECLDIGLDRISKALIAHPV